MATQYMGTGRRKTSVARVFLTPGNGKFIINKKDIEEYFDYDTLKVTAKSPLEVTESLGKFDVYVTVKGGGFTGQAGAIRHGIARALLEISAELRPVLKRAGYLTRDPRKKERKKYGLKRQEEAHNSQRDSKYEFKTLEIFSNVFLYCLYCIYY